MLIRVLRSWQLMAAIAVVAFGVAAAAAMAQASGYVAPTAADGFGDAPPPATATVADADARDSWVLAPPAGADADGHAAQGARDRAPAGPAPVRVHIPAIGVDAPTIPLHLRANGEIEVPEDPDDAGWWADGPTPGTPGPTVVLGHVNDWSGPAVFSELHALGPGDEILVDLEDGSSVVYKVTAGALYAKTAFPTDAVYRAEASTSLLRLVTCGGTLDRDDGSYDSNYVIFAHQTGSVQADHRLDGMR